MHDPAQPSSSVDLCVPPWFTISAVQQLADQDSNLDKQNQNLLCYRYTIGQDGNRRAHATRGTTVIDLDLEETLLRFFGIPVQDADTHGPEKSRPACPPVSVHGEAERNPRQRCPSTRFTGPEPSWTFHQPRWEDP